MFSSDNDAHNMVAVALKLTSGEVEKGQVHGGMTGKLADALNKPTPFVELIGPDGAVALIAKTSIARIEPVEVPKINQLSKRIDNDAIPDPHKVLGLKTSAGQNAIQDAYHSLAKQYHPDNFSGQDVPGEVLDYVSAMFTRITTAYNELKVGMDQSAAA